MEFKIWSVEFYGWDHGNTIGLYSTYDKAKSAALIFLEKQNNLQRKIYGDDPEDLEEMLFKEKEEGMRWSNSLDHISIYEKEVQ